MKMMTKNQFFPLLAGMTLVAGVTALAPAAGAAQLLSNLASPVDGNYGGNPDAANAFTTGNVGLNLDSINIIWAAGGSGGAPVISILTDNSGLPSTTMVGGLFNNPSSVPVGGGTLSYSGSATLAANTTYWLAISIPDGSQPAYTFFQTVTSDPATQGASIGSSVYGNIGTGAWTTDAAILLFAINGEAVGGPTPTTPEPGSLLGLGLVGGSFLLRKRVKK